MMNHLKPKHLWLPFVCGFCMCMGLAAVPGQTDTAKPPVDDTMPTANAPAVQRVDELELLNAVGQRMDQVRKRLVEGRTAAETQQIQREIIAELQRLLDQQGQNPSQSQSKTEEQKSDQNDQSADPDSSSGKTGKQESDPTAGTDQAATTEQTVMSKEFQDKIWGHLPDRLRDQMRNSEVEKFLPKYEQMIRAYYRRLAAQLPDR